MEKLEDTKIFQEDWIGLKKLSDAKRLHYLSMSGDHMDFDGKWFRDNIVSQFYLPDETQSEEIN